MSSLVQPRISIVTVVRNDREGLARTIASVRAQTYGGIEFIVIDGLSDDGTQEVIAANSDLIGFSLSERDQGIYDAMNKGIAAATGDLILFLNARDVFAKDSVLEDFVARDYRAGRQELYLFSVRKDSGKLIRPRWVWLKRMFTLPANHQGIIYPADIMKRIGFSTRYRIAADYHNYYLLSRQVNARVVDATLTIFDTSGVSSRDNEALNREYFLIFQELGIHPVFALLRRLQIRMDGVLAWLAGRRQC
jgi:glycosyltransferase involved in cell wall biosynthesis